MVRLSDDAFMMPEPRDVRPTRISDRQRELLRGIGDRHARSAEDMVANMGIDLRGLGVEEPEKWVPEPDKRAEWLTPDGIRRAGIIHEITNEREAVVQINDGEYCMIPIPMLEEPRQENTSRMKEAVRAAISGGGGLGTLKETGSLIPINASGKDFKMTLQYGHVRPTDQDVFVYTAAKYPDAKVLDADDTHPGKLGVIVHFPEGRSATTLPQVSPSQYMEPSMQEDSPNGEGIPGTGFIGNPTNPAGTIRRADDDEIEQVEAAFKRLARLNPRADFIETSFEQDDDGVRINFDVPTRTASRQGDVDTAIQCFIETRQGRLRGGIVTDQGVVPLHQFFRVGNHPAYSMGHGPQTVHEDEKSGFEDGDYAIKADVDLEAGPLKQRDMGPLVKPRDEQERYELEMQERKNKERRLHERRKQMQPTRTQTQVEQPHEDIPAETGTMPGLETGPGQFGMAGDVQSEEDGEVREHLGGPGLQVANRDAILKRLANVGVQKGDQLSVLSDIEDSEDQPIPSGTTLTVKETDVGRYGDVLLTDGTAEYILEPSKIEQLYTQDEIEFASSGGDPEEKAKAAGRGAFERGFRQATKVHELAEEEFPQSPQLQQLFVSAYMEAAREGQAHEMISTKLAADKKTKEYYRGLFSDGYGKKLTDPVKSKKHKCAKCGSDKCSCSAKKEAQRRVVHTMRHVWAHYNLGRPTPEQIFKVSYLLQEGRRRVSKRAATGLFGGDDPLITGFGQPQQTQGSPTQPGAAGQSGAAAGGAAAGGGDFTDMLIMFSQFNPTMRERVDKMVVDAIAKNPKALASLAPEAYKSLVTAGVQELQQSNPEMLKQMQQGIEGALGQEQKPGIMQRVKDWWSKEDEAPAAPGPMTHEGPTTMGPGEEPAAAPGAPATDEFELEFEEGPEPEDTGEMDLQFEEEPWGTPAEVEEDLPPAARTPTQAPAVTPGAPAQQQPLEFSPKVEQQMQSPGLLQRMNPFKRRQTSKKADASSDAYGGRRQPAKNQLRFKLDRLVNRGNYLVATVVWDPDDMQGMGPANVRHNVVSFIKQKASEKDFIDLGFISRPRLNMCDTDAGIAEVIFRSSEARSFVPEYTEAEGDFYEPIA